MNNIFKILALIILVNQTLFAVTSNTQKIEIQNIVLENGYNAAIKANTPLTKGQNNINIIILKNNKIIKNADVNVIFSLPSIPNLEFGSHAKEKNNQYNLTANFKEIGEWEYELMFKTTYGVIYSHEGRFNIN